MTDAAPVPLPQAVPGYRILDRLGTHLGTQRFKAVQNTLGRPVVLHILTAEAARKSMCAASFEREMKVCSMLRHENVVGAIDAGEHHGDRYFVTEYVEGSTLHEALKGAETWEVRRAVTMALDIARALVHLESLKLVHREISPRAIALSETGAARLVDFGRAKFLAPDAAETWQDTAVGVALYMAPEVARGERGIDSRTDIYSLGCVLYHVLAGRPPYYGRNVAVVLDALRRRKPRDPRWLRPDLPIGVVRVLDKCLKKPRAERYPTASALCADLEAVLAGKTPAPGASIGSAWERPYEGGS